MTRSVSSCSIFAGPEREGDAEQVGKEIGMDVVCFDILRSKHHNLLDDLIWGGIGTDVEAGVYDGVLMAPPCGTFCRARRGIEGPRAIRTTGKPYGIKDITPQEKEAARIGTSLALRSLAMARICESLLIP